MHSGGMKLATYLDEHGISDAEFAASVARDRSTVTRWRNGQTPDAEAMRVIANVTGGQVTPNDFILPDVPERAA